MPESSLQFEFMEHPKSLAIKAENLRDWANKHTDPDSTWEFEVDCWGYWCFTKQFTFWV